MENLKLKSDNITENDGSPDTFETALHELENVVSALESGGVPLEKSLQLLQHGLQLAQRCEATLSAAELALEKLVMTADGELLTERVEDEDED